jgi:hypothetical protein
MKKLLVCVMTVSALLTFNPSQSMAAVEATPTSTPVPNAADAAKVNVMVNRLNEIDAMDKSNMSASEKKVLRKEVRVIKKEIQRSGGGVYLSVGAILLIVILLIVLL